MLDHDMTILAIDLGKRSAVFCDYHASTARTAYGTVKMTDASSFRAPVHHTGRVARPAGNTRPSRNSWRCRETSPV